VSGALEGKVVALVVQGSALDRALAVGCAEAGAAVALATVARDQEFAVASIANEVWAIGRDQFVTLLDATDPAAVMAFAEEVADRFGRCDALVAAHHLPSNAPLDELSPDEWQAALAVNLTGPFLAAHAFGIVIDRLGEGTIVFLSPREPEADAAYRAARAGLAGLAAAMDEAWGGRGVRVTFIEPDDPAAAATAVVAAIAQGATGR
jgi:gluconate 5-dehydrogenase